MYKRQVLIDGDHTIEVDQNITIKTLTKVYEMLDLYKVSLEGTLLKPNMVTSGSSSSNRAPATEVASRTVEAFEKSVPSSVPGIVFLSGGQPDDEATLNMNEIALFGQNNNAPWELSYSFGRGLQALPLNTWLGIKENVPSAQQAFIQRCILTSAARQGKYSAQMEDELTRAN